MNRRVALELQPVLKNRTGVGWYTYEIVKSLLKEDGNTDYSGFYFKFPKGQVIPEEVASMELEQSVCTLMPYGVYQRLWNYIPLSYSSLFRHKADICHFFNYLVPPGVNGKTVVTVYDMVFKKFPETMTGRNLRRLEKNLTASVKRADIITTISENSKEEIIQYLGIAPDRIKIISPGVDVMKYSREMTEAQRSFVKEKYHLPDKYILYLGTLEPRKNVESVVDTYAEFRKNSGEEVKLVIAGRKGWQYDNIFQRVERYGLEKSVFFTGYVDEEDKPFLYKLAEVFIFPTLYEGFGMPIVEAMAAGIPVVASDNSSLPEVAGDAAALFNAFDCTGMARELKELLENEGLRAERIRKGLLQSSKFTWEKSAGKLAEIYSKL